MQAHGPYANADVYELVEGISPDVIWFPALWPETYSYTLSIALHLGLPVVVPNIGAFVERVRNRPYSSVCNWDSDIADWRSFWRNLLGEGMPAAAGIQADGQLFDGQNTAGFYEQAYLAATRSIRGELRLETRLALGGNYHAGLPKLSRRERILAIIWRLSRSPVVARLLAMVPFRLQQAIKRRLSVRPMHDIVRRS
ncbi:MAG: hypothetical protein DRP64_10735 [Verrucomicrobia bacterium]|nr:MAG: hypothetical protein DRP64_10735 [Verrucomicrobiota bacterium]